MRRGGRNEESNEGVQFNEGVDRGTRGGGGTLHMAAAKNSWKSMCRSGESDRYVSRATFNAAAAAAAAAAEDDDDGTDSVLDAGTCPPLIKAAAAASPQPPLKSSSSAPWRACILAKYSKQSWAVMVPLRSVSKSQIRAI